MAAKRKPADSARTRAASQDRSIGAASLRYVFATALRRDCLGRAPGASDRLMSDIGEVSSGTDRRATGLRVAVCIDSRDGPGRERLLGVYRYALARGWRLILVRTDDRATLRQVIAQRPDCALLYDKPAAIHRRFRDAGITCIETGSRNLALDDAAVYVDDAAVTEQAVRHLVDAGFEHFGYCGLGRNRVSAIRAESFTEKVGGRGATAMTFADVQADGGADLENLIAWLKSLPKPAGVLAFDDKLAERVLAACRWAEIKVPDEIGVIGIGDDALICELAYPVLSSVALPTQEIGRRAAEFAEELVACGRLANARCPLPPIEVVPRASTERYVARSPSVAAAIDYARTEHHRPIGIEQIASAVGVPRRTLERRFAAEMNATVHDFLVELRLNRAKRLLRQSFAPLGEVAQACGYLATSSFARMFEAQTGERPEAFRRKFH